MDSRDTRPYLHSVQDQPWSFNGPYRAPKIDLLIFEKIWASLYFCILSNKKTIQGNLGTQDHTSIVSRTILGPSMDPTRPLKWTL